MYLAFRLARFAPPDVAISDRELLPHVFTFTPQKRGSYFLWHYLYSGFYKPESPDILGVQCSVSPGLSSPILPGAIERLAAISFNELSGAKLIKPIGYTQSGIKRV